jgi:hypothetical protein
MRLTLLILIAASSIGCGPALGPRPALAEVPIGTSTAPKAPSEGEGATEDATSKSGMVAAKIEDSDAKKSPRKEAPRRAPKKNSRR